MSDYGVYWIINRGIVEDRYLESRVFNDDIEAVDYVLDKARIRDYDAVIMDCIEKDNTRRVLHLII